MPLVLSRNKDESIVIGEGENAVTITFLGNKGRQAKLGITAPPNIPINREEIFEAKCARGELQPKGEKPTKTMPLFDEVDPELGDIGLESDPIDPGADI